MSTVRLETKPFCLPWIIIIECLEIERWVRVFAILWVIENCETEIFSWADGSFGNLFIAFFNGKSSLEEKIPEKRWGVRGKKGDEEKEETKPEDRKHTHAMTDITKRHEW